MVNVWTSPKIVENGAYTVNVLNGEILKIVAFTKTKLVTTKLKIETMDGEILCDDYLLATPTRFYPKNITQVSQEQTHIDNYYVFGVLQIEVAGLGDGESIESIAIYYK